MNFVRDEKVGAEDLADVGNAERLSYRMRLLGFARLAAGHGE